jgi:hypothetical protein
MAESTLVFLNLDLRSTHGVVSLADHNTFFIFFHMPLINLSVD